MVRRSPPEKVMHFEPTPPRLARNIIIESTFDIGRRLRSAMRADCDQLAALPVGPLLAVAANRRSRAGTEGRRG